MTIVHGRVVNGLIEVDGFALRDGLEVEVSIPAADGEYDLTEEQEAEIEASIAEIERGEYVDGDDIIRELRRRSRV
jgi:predicted transcriptional regulator